MNVVEFRAGPEQVLVVYQPPDLSSEVEPLAVFAEIAADAERRAARGEWIVSMTSLPLRHAGTAFGQEGSGYETKVAIAVVYGRLARATESATATPTAPTSDPTD